MAEINVLDSSIFNRIAAGEVVENAASIVKELVENSIDAGAKNITIEIQAGGNSLIRVIDDGKGISKDEMPVAFLPHATSKIKSLSDLDSINTLGFRGEALPSISSVAKVTMVSKTKNSQLGYCVVYEDGKLVSEFETGAANGTTITVENLFSNIPARKKFLKKDSVEASKISDLIQKLILANPNIIFKFINEHTTVFHSSGQGLNTAIYTIYGDTVNNLIKLPCDSTMSDIVLCGYVSKPTFSKHNKTFQTLIVNGRVVESEEISYCIFLCYQEYLMKRQYPMYVLSLTIPLDTIDVNVHPNKLQIKFADFSRIKNCIMGAVKKCINLEILSPKSVASFENPSISLSLNSQTDYIKPFVKMNSEVLFKNNENNSVSTESTNPFNFHDDIVFHESKNRISQANKTSGSSLENASYKSSISSVQSDMGIEAHLSIIGKIFNTYIILQKLDSVFLIDQHAAHERILYDKLINQIENQKLVLQDLLLPYVFSVTASESELIVEAMETINKCGFTMKEFGLKAFSVSAIPVVCSNINLQEFVSELLEQLKAGAVKKTSFIKDTLAQTACKAAVKGADNLAKSEIEALVKQIETSDSPLLCPHGRPTIIKINKKEIERWFKRIV